MDIKTIEKQIDETRHLLKENTNKLVERDSHLDDIERQTANLQLNSNRFKKNTVKLKRKMITNYYMFWIIISFILMIIIILIIKLIS